MFIRLTILIVVSVIFNFGFEGRNVVLFEPELLVIACLLLFTIYCYFAKI